MKNLSFRKRRVIAAGISFVFLHQVLTVIAWLSDPGVFTYREAALLSLIVLTIALVIAVVFALLIHWVFDAEDP